ncbi:MAG: 50S ribosomal protein L22 [Enterobacteriaceae bacterium]
MKVIAKCLYVRSSPQKVRLVVNLIRNKKVKKALEILEFCNRKASFIVKKLLISAICNAKNNFNLDYKKLFVSKIFVDKAKNIKRILPRAKGRVNYIVKKTSHITIVLSN